MKQSIAKLKILLLLLAVFLIGSGCTISQDKNALYDEDDKIVRQGDSYSFKNREMTLSNTEIDITYDFFYGCFTLWYLSSSKESEVTLDYESEVDSGRFKIVIISPDNTILTFIEGEKNGQYTFPTGLGEYRIKIVGNNAYGALFCHLTVDDGISVHSND